MASGTTQVQRAGGVMFENVTHGRAERRAFFQLHGISAAMAAHAACGLAFVAVSAAAPAAVESVETATYLLLQTPAPFRDAAPPLREPAAAQPAARAATPRIVRPRAEPRTPAAAPADAPSTVSELALRTPDLKASVVPPSAPALDASLLRGLGDAGRLSASGSAAGGTAADVDEAGAAPVVAPEMLAHAPVMVNRRVITRVMSERYPETLLWAGIGGEVVVSFIIGVDGRPEMERVDVISASDARFVPAALRGLRAMRFRPAQLDGRPVRVRVTLPLVWHIPAQA